MITRDSRDETALEYREKLKALQEEMPSLLSKSRIKLRNFINSYSDSFDALSTQKAYLDLKEEFRDLIFKIQHTINVHRHKASFIKGNLVNVVKSSELDSYKDKDSVLEYRMRDINLYISTLYLYLDQFKYLLKDLHDITYNLKM